MGRRLPNTPRSQVRSALRKLFLRSRERASAIKAAHYTCVECGAKQSRAQGREVYVEIHHKMGVMNWDAMFDMIYKMLLCDPANLECLCEACHKSRTDAEKQAQESPGLQ